MIRFATGVDKHQSVCMLSGISTLLFVNHASNGLESCLYTWLCYRFCLNNAQGTCSHTFSLQALILIS